MWDLSSQTRDRTRVLFIVRSSRGFLGQVNTCTPIQHREAEEVQSEANWKQSFIEYLLCARNYAKNFMLISHFYIWGNSVSTSSTPIWLMRKLKIRQAKPLRSILTPVLPPFIVMLYSQYIFLSLKVPLKQSRPVGTNIKVNEAETALCLCCGFCPEHSPSLGFLTSNILPYPLAGLFPVNPLRLPLVVIFSRSLLHIH